MSYRFNPFTGTFDATGSDLATLDARYVNVTGDAMTGALTITGADAANTIPLVVTQNDVTNSVGVLDLIQAGAGANLIVRNTNGTNQNYIQFLANSDNQYPFIKWRDNANVWVAGLVAHEQSALGSDHRHFSIYTTDASNVNQGRFYVQYGRDDPDITAMKIGTFQIHNTSDPDTDSYRANRNYTDNALEVELSNKVTDAATYTLAGNVAKLKTTQTETSGTINNSVDVLLLEQFGDTGKGLVVDNRATGNSIHLKNDATDYLIVNPTGSLLTAGYVRVGSITAPTNTAAGDMTAYRLSVIGSSGGTDDAFSSTNGYLTQVKGTLTDTTAGAKIGVNNQITLTPGSSSSSEFRSFQMSLQFTSSNNFTGSPSAVFVEPRFVGNASTPITISNMYGVRSQGVIMGSTAQNFTTISNAYAYDAFPINAFGTNTGTITQATAFLVRNSSRNSGITLTNQYGIDIQSYTQGLTTNIGLRIAHPALATGLGASTDNIALAIPASSVVISDQAATLTNKHGISIGIATMTSTTNARVITNSASLYIGGAPVASTNVTVTNGPYALWVDANTTRLDGDLDHRGTNLGFFGVTPTTRQTELTDELTTLTFTAPGTPDFAIQDLTNAGGFGFVTKDEGNTVLSVIANLQTRVNELETKLTAYGLLQDAD